MASNTIIIEHPSYAGTKTFPRHDGSLGIVQFVPPAAQQRAAVHVFLSTGSKLVRVGFGLYANSADMAVVIFSSRSDEVPQILDVLDLPEGALARAGDNYNLTLTCQT